MAEPETMSMIELLLLAALSLILAYLIYLFAEGWNSMVHVRRIVEILTEKRDAKSQLIKEQKAHHSLNSRLVRILVLAGITLPPWQIGLLFAMVAMALSAAAVLFLKSTAGVLVGTGAAALLFYLVIGALSRRRHAEFNTALASAITVLVKMMRNGVGFEQALQKSVEVSGSVLFKALFTRFLHEKNSVSEETAFANMDRYIDSRELRIFAIAVKMGRNSGGRFSQTLSQVEQTIRYRKKMRDKIGVATRESNIGSYMIAGLGGGLYLMLDVNFKGKITEYFMHSPYGRWQLLAIVGWIIVGLIVNKLITRIKV